MAKKSIFQKWDCKVFLGMFYWQYIVERSEIFWARLYMIYGILTMMRFAFEYLRSLQYHFHLIFHSEEYELEELQSLSGVLFFVVLKLRLQDGHKNPCLILSQIISINRYII